MVKEINKKNPPGISLTNKLSEYVTVNINLRKSNIRVRFNRFYDFKKRFEDTPIYPLIDLVKEITKLNPIKKGNQEVIQIEWTKKGFKSSTLNLHTHHKFDFLGDGRKIEEDEKVFAATIALEGLGTTLPIEGTKLKKAQGYIPHNSFPEYIIKDIDQSSIQVLQTPTKVLCWFNPYYPHAGQQTPTKTDRIILIVAQEINT
tara:strand:+ start:359 stop:964 length:606 start_codon:yes stop_codon:yes gene_type:complete